ncbi:MAG: hypothetical protein ACLR01_11120 [Vescimonas sp.]
MADHNENLKDTLNEEIEHADQKPAEEHYSLNDDRRVKVLSPVCWWPSASSGTVWR